MTTTLDAPQEELDGLRRSVSESLSELSQADQAPRSMIVQIPFEPHEVDWATTDWIARVQTIHGWLALPAELDSSSPAAFVASLASALHSGRHDQPDLAIDESLDVTTLSRLQERCARALELKKQYLEDLEDGSSETAADQRWMAAWDDAEVEDESVLAEPVSASVDTWPIADFARKAEQGRMNLSPSYQRGDVWPTPDAQMLIESILRGIPLPSVIILKPQNSATGVFEVVDGKQRLTAILRFVGRHPRALEIVATEDAKHPEAGLKQLFTKDYPKFRIAWKNVTGEQLTDKVERANAFPFKLRSGLMTGLNGQLAPFRGQYYSQIKDQQLSIAGSVVPVADVFEATCDYKIPLIQYTTATPRQIHEVFKLYNKQGKQLNAEEIRNAMYHELGLMRGLLVAAGDSSDPDAVAPFLAATNLEPRESQAVSDLGRSLEDYKFGVTRYKRTKVLSWLASLLLLDSRQPGSKPSRRSTAGQIDELLRRVESNPRHPLREEWRLKELFSLMAVAVETHRAVPDAWHPKLRGGSSGKWEEMPLVGTLLGVTQALLLRSEEEVIDALDDQAQKLAADARADAFRRPNSIQTATQWGYISRLALGVAETLGVAAEDAQEESVRRFGSSGIATLIEVATMPESG